MELAYKAIPVQQLVLELVTLKTKHEDHQVHHHVFLKQQWRQQERLILEVSYAEDGGV